MVDVNEPVNAPTVNFEKRHLIDLLDRPHEPIWLPKGPRKTVFISPNPAYINEPYREVLTRLQAKGVKEVVHLVDVEVPDLSDINKLITKDDIFTILNEDHMDAATMLIELFRSYKDLEELLSVAAYVRDKVNYFFFRYAYGVMLLHREDTNDLDLPLVVSSFPGKFIEGKVLDVAKEYAAFMRPGTRLTVPPFPETASAMEPEHMVAYFREDIGINAHHYHWHEAYPFSGPMDIVNKDRRGELFYYMHQQMVARYNFERFSNHLNHVERFINFDEEIPEVYYSKLDKTVCTKAYVGRPKDLAWGDMDRDNMKIDVSQMMRWRNRLLDAINAGYLVSKDGTTVPLDDKTGIDHLGNAVEASILSAHPLYYGNLHNMGHVITSVVHDPVFRHRELQGVMLDMATAIRDPMFFRWHHFIDDIFQSHKNLLPIYTDKDLNYEGIEVKKVVVAEDENPQNNGLTTSFQQSVIDVQGGLNFEVDGSVLVCVKHLQHKKFTYKITVDNALKEDKMGTCRIFLSPTLNDKKEQWDDLSKQRHFFIEMDRFTCKLKPGVNLLERKSSQSSIILPYERTFRDMKTTRSNETSVMDSTCTCGWPEHMLVPKGNHQGLLCQLFVMISNYEDDKLVEMLIRPQKNEVEEMADLRPTFIKVRNMVYEMEGRLRNIDRVAAELTVQYYEHLKLNNRVRADEIEVQENEMTRLRTVLDTLLVLAYIRQILADMSQEVLNLKTQMEELDMDLTIVYPCDGNNCNDGNSFCGVKNKKYPDARSMGFPFDRNPKKRDTLEDFIKGRSNMAVQDVKITFVDKELKPCDADL